MSIKEKLQSLSEDELRKKIIIPLLLALGCSTPRDTCGPHERGKDVVYTFRDHFLKEKIWGAVIIKKDQITKSGARGLSVLQGQVIDAITSFISPDDPGSTIQVKEILVLTPREMTDEAQKYVHDNSGKSFPSIHFIDYRS